MNGIVNNPSKTFVLPNATIEQAVEIVNRIISNISYKVTSVDNSMATANVWVLNTKSKIHGIFDTFLNATISFTESDKGLQMTIECGKGIGAISDQWELQDCNMFINEALKIAVNPNISKEELKDYSSSAGSIIAAIVVIGLALLYMIS